MAATSKKAGKIFTVQALHPVKYDGTLYGPDQPDGDTFGCRAADVAQLVAGGAIADPGVEAPAEEK